MHLSPAAALDAAIRLLEAGTEFRGETAAAVVENNGGGGKRPRNGRFPKEKWWRRRELNANRMIRPSL